MKDTIRLAEHLNHFDRKVLAGRRRLLALTYEFDPVAFERQFARLLRTHADIDVVVGRPLPPGERSIRYCVWPVRWRGVFHPKLLVFLANSEVLVGIGSANLTAAGLGENLEEWHFFDDSDGPVLAGVRRFLERLVEHSVVAEAAQLNEIIVSLPQSHPNQKLPVLSSLDGKLRDQVGDRIASGYQRLDIVSPINGRPEKLLRYLAKKVKNAAGTGVVVHTNQGFRPKVRGVQYKTLDDPPESAAEEGLPRLGAVHAKLYAFVSKKWVDLFWGSANLSFSAWERVGATANVELLVHSRIHPTAWQQLLNRDLPGGHHWRKANPGGEPQPLELLHDSGWRLLCAVRDGPALTLEATGDGVQTVLLRVSQGTKELKVTLTFQDGHAVAPHLAARLGGELRGTLEWRTPHGEWATIPLNHLSSVDGTGTSGSLVELLHLRYTGRPMPGKSNGRPRLPNDDRDEDELIRSKYLGELDRFALQWRLTAVRLAAASRPHRELWECRVAEARRAVQQDATMRPDRWPNYKQEFAARMLENAWLE